MKITLLNCIHEVKHVDYFAQDIFEVLLLRMLQRVFIAKPLACLELQLLI